MNQSDNCRDILIGINSPSPSFMNILYDMTFMLVPKSVKALLLIC